MAKTKMLKYTLKAFLRDFPDEATCLEWLKQERWPSGIYCEFCKKVTNHYAMTSRKSYTCEWCGNHVHPTAGTIYHKSSTPLTVWFYVAYLMAQTRGGISAKQIERETGVTYKTAWRMCKQIRLALGENNSPFGGDVEMDESFFGGRRHGGRGRAAEGKTIVFGMVERGGLVEARVVDGFGRKDILPIVDASVARTAHIYTDEVHTYKALPAMGYAHDTVPHREKVYVMGNTHTNTIEGFWSNVKNGIRGVYHGVSSKYLQSYLNEYSFRYNHRKDITPMFLTFLQRTSRLLAD
jgi:transposase-like protein